MKGCGFVPHWQKGHSRLQRPVAHILARSFEHNGTSVSDNMMPPQKPQRAKCRSFCFVIGALTGVTRFGKNMQLG